MAIFLLDLVVKRLMKTISRDNKKREGACFFHFTAGSGLDRRQTNQCAVGVCPQDVPQSHTHGDCGATRHMAVRKHTQPPPPPSTHTCTQQMLAAHCTPLHRVQWPWPSRPPP